jgi:hypothetical protein
VGLRGMRPVVYPPTAGSIKSGAEGPRFRRPHLPEWRNWQTRKIQVLVQVTGWRFKSSLGHLPATECRPGGPILSESGPAHCGCSPPPPGYDWSGAVAQLVRASDF